MFKELESRVGVGKFWKLGVGVGHFTFDSATLAATIVRANAKTFTPTASSFIFCKLIYLSKTLGYC